MVDLFEAFEVGHKARQAVVRCAASGFVEGLCQVEGVNCRLSRLSPGNEVVAAVMTASFIATFALPLGSKSGSKLQILSRVCVCVPRKASKPAVVSILSSGENRTFAGFRTVVLVSCCVNTAKCANLK